MADQLAALLNLPPINTASQTTLEGFVAIRKL